MSKKDIFLSRRKYILNLLSEDGMLKCKSIDSPMDVNTKLLLDKEEPLEDIRRYKRFVRKLNYLTMTRPDITIAVSVVSYFLSVSRNTHLEAVMKILRYLKKASRRELLFRS